MPTTTHGAAVKVMDEFKLWFEAALADGSIPQSAQQADFTGEFFARRLEAVEARCRRDIKEEIETKAERRDREEDKKGERDRVARLTELKAQGKGIAVIDGTDKGALRVWLDKMDRVGILAKASGEELIKFSLTKATGQLEEIVFGAWEKKGTHGNRLENR